LQAAKKSARKKHAASYRKNSGEKNQPQVLVLGAVSKVF
jgi:hypothetical protein